MGARVAEGQCAAASLTRNGDYAMLNMPVATGSNPETIQGRSCGSLRSQSSSSTDRRNPELNRSKPKRAGAKGWIVKPFHPTSCYPPFVASRRAVKERSRSDERAPDEEGGAGLLQGWR